MRCRSVRPTQQFLAQKFVCDNLEFRENELPSPCIGAGC